MPSTPLAFISWYLVYFSLFAYAYRLCITLPQINLSGKVLYRCGVQVLKRNGVLIIYALLTYLLLPLVVNTIGAILGSSFFKCYRWYLGCIISTIYFGIYLPFLQFIYEGII